MTLIIGMVGSDGIVAAGDRRWLECYSHDGERLDQWLSNAKHYESISGATTCFGAGGTTANEIAMKIAYYGEQCDYSNRAKWELILHSFAVSMPIRYTIPMDHVIVVRKDSPNAFWAIQRTYNRLSDEKGEKTADPVAVVRRVDSQFCVGGAAVAQFLPRHLYLKQGAKRPIAELQKLAVLTLSYAAEEQPTNIAPPFDVMTMDRAGNITWSVHEPMHGRFQEGIERLFDEQNIDQWTSGGPTMIGSPQ